MCNQARVKLNGRYANGKQRFYCLNCHKSFSWQNKAVKKIREFIWFKRWIMEGYSVRQLSSQSGLSPEKIRAIINYWLSRSPQQHVDYRSFRNLVFDGTFIYKRATSVLGLLDSRSGKLIAGRYDMKENSPSQLLELFVSFRDAGLTPKSCTTDGNPQVIACLRNVWPQLIIQRCLVHIQRQGLMWCRINPKNIEAQKLRMLFVKIAAIKTLEQKNLFLRELDRWERVYGSRIARRPEKGWVFPDVKRARSMILKALPNMFHYLDDNSIPATTNQIEGYFSRLKDKYHNHRGLSPKKRSSYFAWYFFLKP